MHQAKRIGGLAALFGLAFLLAGCPDPEPNPDVTEGLVLRYPLDGNTDDAARRP